MCLVIYRLGAHIATPGVNVQVLSDFVQNQGAQTLFGVYDMFVGGGFSRATVLALGIMPYISASIMFQLAGAVFPYVEKLQKEEEGRKKITQWTRYTTVLLAGGQAYGFGIFTEQLAGAVTNPGWGFRMVTMLTLTTGAIFVMWLSSKACGLGFSGPSTSCGRAW
jgi:preprotein translocase subunit SecY